MCRLRCGFHECFIGIISIVGIDDFKHLICGLIVDIIFFGYFDRSVNGSFFRLICRSFFVFSCGFFLGILISIIFSEESCNGCDAGFSLFVLFFAVV